ncbi:RNA polymerase sigma factor [Inhella sp.]|uniref:RNA polymerase sigma factor n=1 Tax=Inhella sp. TaxID=1921806 RepID=UPI0035AE5FC1
MSDAALAVTAVWRLESAKIVGALTRLTHDLALAEDCAQDALLAALERWPSDGLPRNPGAWLMTTAKHRALDRLRHGQMAAREQGALGEDMDARRDMLAPDTLDILLADEADPLGDDVLKLLFIACHPGLAREAQWALTLRLVCGLTTAEIGRALRAKEATVAQRISRAKAQLEKLDARFELPDAAERDQRLAQVLTVLYLMFNEGYTATAGPDWMRPELCHEALRLTRMLAALCPDAAEACGLQALMEIQASRLGARLDGAGKPVLLLEQDRRRWDPLLIRRGLAALARAQGLPAPGSFTLQAAIAACHARAARAVDTDWAAIVAGYDELLALQPGNPVVALNRAVAVGMASGPGMGPGAALPLVEGLVGQAALQGYPWLPSVHADLLIKLGRPAEAAAALHQAMAWTDNEAERRLLEERLRALGEH